MKHKHAKIPKPISKAKLAIEFTEKKPKVDEPQSSANTLRTIYFHTGTHKTGSTALQLYFAANKKLLEEEGISYAFFNSASQETGNGLYLFQKIFGQTIPDEELEELIEFYLSGRALAICSAEDFTRLNLKEWKRIKKTCLRLNIQVKVVTFIRNISPYYLSLHGEFIKAGQLAINYKDFIKKDYYFPVISSLKVLVDVFGKMSISVIHYDSVLDKIDTAFMHAVGLTSDNYDRSVLGKLINRSLTNYEQEIVLKVSKATGALYTPELTELLIGKLPQLKSQKRCQPDEIDILMERHNVDVEWLNKTFFNDKQIVGVSSSDLSSESISADERQSIDLLVMDWCIKKLGTSSPDDARKFILNRISVIDWSNASDPAIPYDFDPVAYLINNPDLLNSSNLPYEHYIEHGVNEKGRKYTLPNKSNNGHGQIRIRKDAVSEGLSTNSHTSTLVNENLVGAQYLQNEMLRNRNEMLTKALKQWQNYAKETSDKATQRERELYEQLLLAVKEKSK